MPKKKKKRQRPIFCEKCGRITFSDQPDYEWWLVGIGTDRDVIRCPQHITEWSLRLSGKGRSMEAFRFKRMAKEHDTYDPRLAGIEPLFLEDDFDF